MFKINEYVVYKCDVCKISKFKYNNINNKDYYVLEPVEDESLTIEVPKKKGNEHFRALISKKDIQNIIKEIPNVTVIKENNRMIEREYKKLLKTGQHLDLIKIIKTAHLRNKEREDEGKKTTEKDNKYIKLAEKSLYNEFSLVLEMSYDETKKYVSQEVTKILEK